VKINGVKHYLWRAVDHEGEVLESFVTKRRDKKAALKFLRKSLRRHGLVETIVTDRLASYGAALKALGAIDKREVGRWLNNRVENSHQPFRRRERAMLRFRRMRSLQKFAAVHGSIHNHFNQQRTLISRQIFAARTSGLRTDAPPRRPHGDSSVRSEQQWVWANSETVLVCLTSTATDPSHISLI
jgi:putative transposase